ncbi:MAG: hypothetical protein AAF843_09095 [Bacteroidota bacterium]
MKPRKVSGKLGLAGNIFLETDVQGYKIEVMKDAGAILQNTPDIQHAV